MCIFALFDVMTLMTLEFLEMLVTTNDKEEYETETWKCLNRSNHLSVY